jgi:hypothetical protein
MIHKKFIVSVILLKLIVLIMGCAGGVGNPPKETQVESTLTRITSYLPTSTESAPFSTSTAAPTQFDDFACRDIVANANLVSDGFLIVSDSRGGYYSVDMQTMNAERFAEESAHIAFSTNSQSFAYLSLEDNLLVVKSDELTKRLPWERTWFSIARWIDSENIQINEDHTSTSPQVILNPFSGTSVRLTSDFEDIYNLDSNLNWDGLSLVSYSPDLQFAAYPRLDENGPSLVLVSTEDSTPIVRLFPINITSYPEWSPNGVFVVGEPLEIDPGGQLLGYELFLVGLNGDVQKITAFSEHFDYPFVNSYQWSTDYKNIAFWFTGERRMLDSQSLLGIVDIEKQSTMLTCLTTENLLLAPSPVWSPNQEILAVHTKIEGSAKLMIMDVKSLEYRELALGFDAVPVGWISFKP